MEYEEESDSYKCRNGKELKVSGVKKEKTKTGYEREVTTYSCHECKGCPYKQECIKGNNSKKPLDERERNLYVSKEFMKYRKEDFERIVSEVKRDCGFRRFLCRGKVNVEAESLLLAIAHNIRKLHGKIQSERTGTHLFRMKKSA